MNTILYALVQEYILLPYGAMISNAFDLIEICTIDTREINHPHYGMHVYISKRALKHFVESRKKELEKKHSKKETLEMILFATASIEEVYTQFDQYEYEPPIKHFYTKEYAHYGKPSLRILAHIQRNALEIVSIHFKKSKKRI